MTRSRSSAVPPPGAPRVLCGLTLGLPFLILGWAIPLIGHHTIGNDYTVFSQPQQMELQYCLQKGTWPLYVPGFAGGRSAAALTLGQLFHPISHIAALFPAYWQGRALDVVTALRLASLGLTHLVLLLLLRRLRLPLDLAFTLSFITVYNLRMLDAFRFGASLENYTAHLLLFASLAFCYLNPEGRAAPLAAVGSTYLLVVGGHPQIMYFAVLACGMAALFLPFLLPSIRGEPDRSAPPSSAFYGRAVLFVTGGVVLASAYIVPLYLEYFKETAVRTGRGYEWSLLNTDTWSGVLNSFFDPLRSANPGAFGSSSLIAVALVLPLFAAPRARVPRSLTVLWLAGLLVCLVALGEATPLHRLFWTHVPFAHALRVPGRITVMLPLVLLLLLAWLSTRVDEPPMFRIGRLRFGRFSGAFGVATILFLAYNLLIVDALPAPGDPFPYHIRDVPQTVRPATLVLGGLVLALATFRGFASRWRRAAGGALALVVMVQVSLHLYYGTWVTGDTATPTLESIDAAKKKSADYQGNPGDRTYSDLVGARLAHSFLDERLALVYRRWRRVPGLEEAYTVMATERRADMNVVERFDGPPSSIVPPDADERKDTLSLRSATFNRLVFDVVAPLGGFVNLTFLDRNGRWRARVDSISVPTHFANGGEQAVFVTPGRHEVEFRYVSPAAVIGMLGSLAGLTLVLVTLAVVEPRRRRRIALASVGMLLPPALFVLWSSSLYRGETLGTAYTWSSRQIPNPENVAFGRRTTMSSTAAAGVPFYSYSGRGVDGNRRAPGFRTKRHEQDHWWQVDLGQPRRVREIVVYGRRGGVGRPLPLEVLVSDRQGDLETAVVVNERGNGPLRIPLEGREVRFIRLVPSPRKQFHLSEVEVYAAVTDAGASRGRPTNRDLVRAGEGVAHRLVPDVLPAGPGLVVPQPWCVSPSWFLAGQAARSHRCRPRACAPDHGRVRRRGVAPAYQAGLRPVRSPVRARGRAHPLRYRSANESRRLRRVERSEAMVDLVGIEPTTS
jgi:hypothetical protein